MTIGISPLVGFAFKLMLATPGHERVTLHFLNSIFEGKLKVVDVSLKNPYLGPRHETDKSLVLDILTTDKTGRLFNIQMQTSIPSGLQLRLACYDARLLADQLSSGDHYKELRPAIVICVLTKTLLHHHDRLHSAILLRDETGEVFSDVLQVHLLELTKLTVTRENLASATPIDRWA